jgi:hypothetical protein
MDEATVIINVDVVKNKKTISSACHALMPTRKRT